MIPLSTNTTKTQTCVEKKSCHVSECCSFKIPLKTSNGSLKIFQHVWSLTKILETNIFWFCKIIFCFPSSQIKGYQPIFLNTFLLKRLQYKLPFFSVLAQWLSVINYTLLAIQLLLLLLFLINLDQCHLVSLIYC